MMHAESEFLAHIRENPDDDAPRLIFADWLDEQDQGERAEFIRLEIEKAATGKTWCPFARSHVWCGTCDFCKLHIACERFHEDDDLRKMVVGEFAFPYSHTSKDPSHFADDALREWIHLYTIRGFVHTVRCTSADWLTHGPAIVARHPVQRVTLTDTSIFESTGATYFYVGGMWRFPNRYWSKLDRLPSQQAALDALSEVCIAWALREAGIAETVQEFRRDAIHEAKQRETDERYPSSLVPRSFTTQTF